MTTTSIVCANCGAKFKLPEGFQGHRARCSKCGASIDVDAQLAAPEPAPAPRHAARAGARGGYGARGAPARDQEGEPEPKKSKTGLIIGVSVVSLALLGVLAFVLLKDDPKKDVAKGKETAAKTGDKPAGKPADPKTDPPAKVDPAKTDAKKDVAKPKEATPSPTDKTATPAAGTQGTPDAKKPDTAKADAGQKPAEPPRSKVSATGLRVITSPDQIFKPRTLPEQPWAEDVTDAERTEINGQIETMLTDESARGSRARRALAKLGHKAISPLVNKLREADYATVDGNRIAEDVQRTLTDMLMGVNAGFKFELHAPEGKLNLAIADWNARTAEKWLDAVLKWGNKAAFDDHIKQRKELAEQAEKKIDIK